MIDDIRYLANFLFQILRIAMKMELQRYISIYPTTWKTRYLRFYTLEVGEIEIVGTKKFPPVFSFLRSESRPTRIFLVRIPWKDGRISELEIYEWDSGIKRVHGEEVGKTRRIVMERSR